MAQRPRQARIQFQSQFRSPGVDTSGAEVMRQLAGLGRTVGQVAEAIGRPIVEQEMAEKGREEAQKAFEEGREVEAPTPYAWGASQYQAAAARQTAELEREKEKADFDAKRAYESQFRVDTQRAIAQAKIDYKDDPEGFQAWTDSYEKGVIGAMDDPVLAAQSKEYIFSKTFSHQLELQKSYNAKQTAEHIALYGEESTEAFAEAEKLLVKGDLVGAVVERNRAIGALYDIQRVNPDFDAEGQADALNRQFDVLQLKTKVSNIADTGDFSGAFAELQSVEDQVPDNFTLGQWRTAINEAKTELVKQKQLADAAKESTSLEDQLFFDGAIEVLQNDGDLSKADTVRVGMIMANDPVKQKQYETAQEVATFSVMSAADRSQVFNSLDPDIPENQVLLSAYATQDRKIRGNLEKDAWAFAAQQGIWTEEDQDEFAKFDVANMLAVELTPEQRNQMKAAYEKNEEIARKLSMHYGYQFSPLNNQQVEMLTDALPQMTPKEKVELVTVIGPESAAAFEFAKKGAKLFAVTSTIQDPNVQRGIFAGEQKLAKGAVTQFQENKVGQNMYDAFYDVMGNTIGDEDSTPLFEAAKAYYASTFVGENIVYNEGDFKDALRKVAGDVKNARGVKTIPPSFSFGNNDGTVENLEDFFDAMTLDQFVAFGGAADPYTEERVVGYGSRVGAAKIKVTGDRNLDKVHSNDYKIRRVQGVNNYILRQSNGQPLVKPDGSIMIFNITKDMMNDFLSKKQSAAMDVAEARAETNIALYAASSELPGQFPGEKLKATYEALAEKEFERPEGQNMFRADGSLKSAVGYLGPIKANDGSIMTEYSVSVDFDGERVEIPTLVPTLTSEEIDILKGTPDPKKIPESIMEKAIQYAQKRMAAGLDPFYQDGI
jgi:hypothetical protein